MCLPNDQNCPLNDFAISNTQNDELYAGYNKFEVSDSDGNIYYFYYTNTKIDNPIITTFKLSKDYPCMYSLETNWISVFDDEVDKNPTCKTSINGKKWDDRYTQVASGISLISLYKDNNIDIDNAISSEIKKTVNLYTRNFFSKNEECQNKFFLI